MRQFLATLGLALAIGACVPYLENVVHAATCVGGECHACRNCSACKRCSKDGGTCSVCRKLTSK